MDYSALSDLEIAILVGKHFPDEVIVSEDYAYKLIPCAASAYTGIDYEEVDFDPCNNVYDAWPIMIENKIGVIPYDVSEDDKDHGKWFCIVKDINHISNNFNDLPCDKNPLRVAMIVFLMLMENVNG